MKANVKQIFNEIQSLNPKQNCISSLGSYTTEMDVQISDSLRKELKSVVAENTLAHKILSDADNFTEKQLWIIAFELVKNGEYAEIVGNEIAAREAREAAKKARKSSRRHAGFVPFTARAEKAEASVSSAVVEDLTGKTVEHARFGIGTVISDDGENVKVNFAGAEKFLIKKFANLTVK